MLDGAISRAALSFSCFYALGVNQACKSKNLEEEADRWETLYMLLITVDCDDVLGCREYEQVTQIADAICAARPDVFSMDLADNDRCHYPSVVGTPSTGVPMDALAAGHDPYGIIMEKLKAAGIAVVPDSRVNDHHGTLDMWTAWERDARLRSLGKDTGAWQPSPSWGIAAGGDW